MDYFYMVYLAGKSMYFGQWLAQELGMPFIKKRASDLVDKFVGQTEQNIKLPLKKPKRKKLLLFDEADSFFI